MSPRLYPVKSGNHCGTGGKGSFPPMGEKIIGLILGTGAEHRTINIFNMKYTLSNF